MLGTRIDRGIGIALLALILTACGSGTSTTPGGGADAVTGASSTGPDTRPVVEGGILRFGTTVGPDTLNPFTSVTGTSALFPQIYPTLVQTDENLQTTGDWAESWTVSPDGKVYTFTLKAGGKWSDGKLLTAADAAYTGNLIIKYAAGPTAVLAPSLAHAVRLDAPNETTLVITYDAPVATALSQLEWFYVMPQHVLEPLAADNAKDLKQWAPGRSLPIVGGGSFYVTAYDNKGTTILTRNPGFYGEQPHVEAVGWTVYQSADAMLAALTAGQLDAVDTVPATLAKKYQSDPNIQLVIGEPSTLYYLAFNSNPDKPKRRELLDPALRQALAHGVDRQKIIDIVFDGFADPGAAIITPLSGIYNDPSLTPETYDIALGNELLDKAGYLRGADGIRTTPTGDRMEYEVIVPQDVNGIDREFEIIKTGWAELGVSIVQKSLDATAAWNAVTAPDSTYMDFDIVMWTWTAYPDPDFMLSVPTCAQYGGWNDTGYCNPEYDKLYAEQGITIDPEQRKAIVWEMQALLDKDKPYIWTARQQMLFAYGSRWGGLSSPTLAETKTPWIKIYRTE